MTRGGTPEESVHRFGGEGRLVGIVTSPPPEAAARIPVLILGAGIIHRIGPSRVGVELARHLAARGHRVLRFDLAGVGDSDRPARAELSESVQEDISAAVDLLLRDGESRTVAAVGFCSGADNGFYMAAEDPRIQGVVLFDPSVHRTRGFHLRKLKERMGKERSLGGLVRDLASRARPAAEVTPPPGYFGLLMCDPEETDRRAAAIVGRGGKLHYCISRDIHRYCNAPEQVRESLPTGWSEEHITVSWLPELDHILSGAPARKAFLELVGRWIGDLDPCPEFIG